eukprot:3947591-Amphidinium_carterae.1
MCGKPPALLPTWHGQRLRADETSITLAKLVWTYRSKKTAFLLSFVGGVPGVESKFTDEIAELVK